MPKNPTGIITLPNGKYLARYFSGFDTRGRRVYPSKVFTAQSDVKQWRAEQVGALHPGRQAHSLTVAQYLDQWLTIRAANKKIRGNSLRLYRQSIENYIKPELGRVKLSRLNAAQVESWQAELLTRLSPVTCSGVRAILSGALKRGGTRARSL